MGNGKMEKQIRELVNWATVYWEEIGDRYGKRYGFSDPEILFRSYPTGKLYEADDANEVRSSIGGIMVSIISSCGELNMKLPWEDQIVDDTWIRAYVGYEALYRLIIECELDFDRVKACLRFVMRHEMGYAIGKHMRLVGKTIKDWDLENDRHRLDRTTLPKLRKNASHNSRLNWLRCYFELPDEKTANDIIGITDDDVVEHCQWFAEL